MTEYVPDYRTASNPFLELLVTVPLKAMIGKIGVLRTKKERRTKDKKTKNVRKNLQ